VSEQGHIVRSKDSDQSDLESRMVAQAAVLVLAILILVVLNVVFRWG
jgi:hypothetical protein